MDENIDYLARKKREEIETWEDESFYYKKVGTKTSKRRKN